MSTMDALLDDVEIDWSSPSAARAVPVRRRAGPSRSRRLGPWLMLCAAALVAVSAGGLGWFDRDAGGALPAGPELRAPEAPEAPARAAAATAPAATLDAVAHCESRGDAAAVSADGRYRGKYQFDIPTWEGLGGTGDPAEAPESVQDRLAIKLYRQRGTAPWGNCANA
jgi:hypothetical protein